jgi:hypothetical protein
MRLTISSFEDFLRFFFGREADAFKSDTDEEPTLDANLGAIADYYQKLFSNSDALLPSHSREELEQGFAAMIDPRIPISLPEVIWDSAIPLDTREGIVRSMLFLYRDLFGGDPLFGTPFMWWDPIAYDFECGNRRREDSRENQCMQDSMFETLTGILKLPSPGAQKAALHGLGHLHHPRTREVIEEYLVMHPELPDASRQYALQCAAGMIQ